MWYNLINLTTKEKEFSSLLCCYITNNNDVRAITAEFVEIDIPQQNMNVFN